MPILIDEKDFQKLSKRKRFKKFRTTKPPVVAERILRRKITELWRRSVFPALERIKSAISQGMNIDDLGQLIDRELRLAQITFDLSADDAVDMWRLSVGNESKKKMEAGLVRSLGIDIKAVLDEPIVKQALDIGAKEASDLIKTIPGESLSEVKRAVLDNFRGNPLPEGRSLLQQIIHISGKEKFERRAMVIARDQTSKLTGLMDQVRQQEIGISKYIWRTSKDQRVVGNPSGKYPVGNDKHGNHWIMEGKLCRWDDATVYSDDKGTTWKKRTGQMPKNHPGQDILCRCFGESQVDIDEVLKHARAA